MSKTTTITDFDKGYWTAVQNVLSFDIRPDLQTAENLIREAGFNREACLKLIEQSGFNSKTLLAIMDSIYPE